jgi:hypothetical protein
MPTEALLPTAGSYIVVANVQGDHNTVVGGQGNQVLSGVTAGGDVVLGDKVGGDKIVNQQPAAGSGPAAAPPPGGPATRISRQAPPWRVFLSHTSELHQYPAGGSYIDKAERAVSAAQQVIVDIADFPSIDEAPATVCIERVKGCDVYVGIFGTLLDTPRNPGEVLVLNHNTEFAPEDRLCRFRSAATGSTAEGIVWVATTLPPTLRQSFL